MTSITEPENATRLFAGYLEWVALPELKIPAIKAKLDTGAFTSSLHAFNIRTFLKGGKLRVKFQVHPLQMKETPAINCVADVVDQRFVKNSSGVVEERIVIVTTLEMGGLPWPIQLNLTNRDPMKFRMLIGRSAMKHHLLIDPAKAWTLGKDRGKVYGRRRKKKT